MRLLHRPMGASSLATGLACGTSNYPKRIFKLCASPVRAALINCCLALAFSGFNQLTTVWLRPRRRASQVNGWALCAPRGCSNRMRSRLRPASRSQAWVRLAGGAISVNQRASCSSLSSRRIGASRLRQLPAAPRNDSSLNASGSAHQGASTVSLRMGARGWAMKASNSDSCVCCGVCTSCMMPPLAANDADAQAFDHQVLVFQVDFDRGELRVLGQEPDLAAFALEAFDGDFIADAGDDDLAVTGFTSGVDGQQVTVENAHVLHAHAMHPQQVVGARVEEGRVDVGGFEPQFQRNFRARRRVAVVVEAALDKSQNLSLAWRQF